MGRICWAIAVAAVGVLAMASPAAAQDIYNCEHFVSRAAAQAWLDADPSDPHGLDNDNDGLACEAGVGSGGTVGFPPSAPPPPTTAPPTTAPPTTFADGTPCLPGLCTANPLPASANPPAALARTPQELPRTGDDTAPFAALAGTLLACGALFTRAARHLDRL